MVHCWGARGLKLLERGSNPWIGNPVRQLPAIPIQICLIDPHHEQPQVVARPIEVWADKHIANVSKGILDQPQFFVWPEAAELLQVADHGKVGVGYFLH